MSVALAVLLAAGATIHAQPPGVAVSASADRPAIRLSESVRVTVAVEGPAPLRVNPPAQVLAADADADWRIRPDGAAEILPLANGRFRWRQVYRLDPWAPPELLGEPLRVTFNPFTVNDREAVVPGITVTVTKTIGDPATTPPRPVTAVEDVPPPPPPPDTRSWVAPAVALALVWLGVLAGVAVLVVVRARARRAKPLSPTGRARAALAKLEASDDSGAAVMERIAAILRGFVSRRFALPATRLTTAELSARAVEHGWPADQIDALRALLDACDRAKFAGDVPKPDACQQLIRAAAEWVDNAGRAANPA